MWIAKRPERLKVFHRFYGRHSRRSVQCAPVERASKVLRLSARSHGSGCIAVNQYGMDLKDLPG
jgi:hypothetical protein